MKKLVSILLAMALILSLSTTAFATAVTIADDDAVTRTYNGYKLLNLTISPKTGTHPDGCDGTNHVDGCYNYAYTVNEKYEGILKNLATEAGKTDIIEYLAGQSSDSKNDKNEITSFGSLHEAAEAIYAAIQDQNITPDANDMTDTANIDQGYWLFADVTNLSDKNAANSLVIVDTKGQDSLTITPKTGLPTLEKKVKDTNDSTGETTDWQDSADHDITDTVDFQLTATMPENIASYDTYAIIFHDNLSEGLTLLPGTIKVMMYANEDATTGTDVTASFNKPDTAPANGEFTISHNQNNINNVKALGATKDSIFVVTYSATLNENAVIGAAGNPNTAYLEFSNNPYDEGTGNTTQDEVIVFTYQLTINKTDAAGAALPGAGFTLYKKDSSGNFAAVGKELGGEGSELTTFEWKGLDDGVYKLVETTVPDGYNKMADVEFSIAAEHDEESDNPALTKLTTTYADASVDNGTITNSVENKTGTVLPETGARGTFMLITISTMFVMVAAVFMVVRKKMSIYED